jgi:hypothetical protein
VVGAGLGAGLPAVVLPASEAIVGAVLLAFGVTEWAEDLVEGATVRAPGDVARIVGMGLVDETAAEYDDDEP